MLRLTELVEATCVGNKPESVRIGDIMMPPPNPSIEPTMPAAYSGEKCQEKIL